VNLISTQSGSRQAGPGHRPGRPAERGGWGTRLLRGRADDPAWARPALLALLLATAVLYLAGLSRNGYANEFAAAVQPHEELEGVPVRLVDSSNFITVDKTPASWVMELSGRLFGFSSWSLLVPQALERGHRRRCMPRSAGGSARRRPSSPERWRPSPRRRPMFRFDNPDALLVLVRRWPRTPSPAIESRA
jgi:hypothetical protein